MWVLRHGKAAPDPPPGRADRDRPLASRGRRDATALGKRLAGPLPVLGLPGIGPPDHLICSAAVRTRETAELVAEAFGGRLPVEPYRSLYGADPDAVMGLLREIDDGPRGVMLVGHNPTMFELVWELLAGMPGSGANGFDSDADGPGNVEGNDRAVLEVHGFPTCALAVLAVRAPGWADLLPGCASLEGLFRPPY